MRAMRVTHLHAVRAMHAVPHANDCSLCDLSDRDQRMARLFITEVLGRAFARLMTDDYLSYVAPLPLHVLEAVRLLCSLAVMIGVRYQRNMNSVDEAVRNLNAFAVWPVWHALGAVLDMLTTTSILEILTAAHEDATAEMPAPAEWHTLLVCQLVQERGFQMCIQVSPPSPPERAAMLMLPARPPACPRAPPPPHTHRVPATMWAGTDPADPLNPNACRCSSPPSCTRCACWMW
jgi:hypothetical protein